MQHLQPVSNNEPKGSISLFSLLSFFLNKGKEGSLAHKFARGGEEKIVVCTRRRSSKVLPCREANDRKAKLPKFEQSVFKFFDYLPRTTLLCMENLCAEEPTRS